MFNIMYLDETCKLKRDSITHLLDWLRSKKPTTQNAVGNAEQWELACITEGNAK